MPFNRRFLPIALLAAGALAGCGRNTPLPNLGQLGAQLAGRHHFDHVVVIVLENEDAPDVFAVPYMDSLARSGAALRNYYAVAHPSYPNYLALVAGKTFIDDPAAVPDPVAYNGKDFGDAQKLIDAPSLAERLEAQRDTWDVLAEDYPIADSLPTRCDFSRRIGNYARKHVPFLSFKAFRDHPELCAHVRNLKWFRPDSLPAYTFIAPNMIHDGHDAPLSTAVTWLRGFLGPVLADSSAMRSTLIVVTFDESASNVREKLFGAARPNLVYTAMVGGMIKPGSVSNDAYSHFSLLRTIEENFGLSPALAPGGTNSIDGVWK